MILDKTMTTFKFTKLLKEYGEIEILKSGWNTFI